MFNGSWHGHFRQTPYSTRQQPAAPRGAHLDHLLHYLLYPLRAAQLQPADMIGLHSRSSRTRQLASSFGTDPRTTAQAS